MDGLYAFENCFHGMNKFILGTCIHADLHRCHFTLCLYIIQGNDKLNVFMVLRSVFRKYRRECLYCK